METILFEGVQGMEAYQAKSVIRMKLAARGFYDVEFTEILFKGQAISQGGMNHVFLYVDERNEVVKCPVFKGRDWL